MPTEPSSAYLYPASVVSTRQLAPSYMLTVFSCPQVAKDIQPGQFVNIEVPGDPSELLRLPMSYSQADPEAGTIDVAYRVVGKGTERMAALPAGTELSLIGPAGHGWRFPAGARAALCVGGGSGMAPALAAAEGLAARGVAVDLVEGAQTAAQIVLEDEARAIGIRDFVVTTDDGTRGIEGFASAAVERLLAQNAYDLVCVCGPRPMMAGIVKLAKEAGVACQVSMEAGMCCGFGICGTCPVDGADSLTGKLAVCMDGPVFDAQEVAW